VSAPRVKVCGLTDPAEARACAEAGAWAVGVVFAPSPRRVGVDQAARVLDALPPETARVGVFVDPAPEDLERAVRACALTHVQLHGTADTAAARATGRAVWVGVGFDGPDALARAAAAGADLTLFDAAVPGRHGGTGRRLDWAALARALGGGGVAGPVGLAGGLDPGNVAEAVRVVRPDLVDVSSGVEWRPGRKDPERVRAFCEGARAAAAPAAGGGGR